MSPSFSALDPSAACLISGEGWAVHSRFVQRIRRRYAPWLGLLTEAALTRPTLQQAYQSLRADLAGLPLDDPDAMAALGYDSAQLLADAMRRAGSAEPAKVRDALAATRDFDGVTGRMTLDASRNARKSAVILAIQKGEFVYKETVNP
jgi:ABC-type branched-subunit amino acid transport system substrate-binding protein